MSRTLAVVALAMAACSFDSSGIDFSHADAGMGGNDATFGGADAGAIDATSPPMITPSNGVGPAELNGVIAGLSFAASSTSTISSDTGEIITDDTIMVRGPGGGVVDGIRFAQLTDSVAVLGVTSVSVGQSAYVRVIGSRALVLLSRGDVTIYGAIDVSGGCIGGGVTCGGPGGGSGTPDEAISALGCAPGRNGSGANGGTPETGVGGGSFGTAGAPAGDADGSHLGGVAGALPGTCTGAALVPLMGGSGGGSGGVDNCGGDGGGGGGGLQISSYGRIDIIGPALISRPVGINAAGAGGRGGEASDGGGGGGSGGGILLEALNIKIVSAVLAANGGGGGGGGNQPDSATGQPGSFGSAQASGGDDDRAGGSGAALAGGATAGEGGGDNTGGGGGGIGIIRLNVSPSGLDIGDSVIISPAFTRGDPGGNP